MEDDISFHTVQRYIHQNPVKAGLVKQVGEYKWSSFREYIKQTNLVDVKFSLDILSDDQEKAIEKFIGDMKMSRQVRKLSATGYYHIVFRGINRQSLFEEESDFLYFLESLQQLKSEMAFGIHAYCLMSNHVHLLLKENKIGDISQIMKRLLTKYAMYFNKKYERSGALIASRYKSTPVEVDEYFIPLIRYIHQNPVKARIVGNPEEYKFSSYRDYVRGGRLTDTRFSLGLLGRDEWVRFHQMSTDDNFDISGKINLSESEVRRRILRSTEGREPHEIVGWSKPERDAMLRQLKEKEGLSIRQIERATGVSRGVIARS